MLTLTFPGHPVGDARPRVTKRGNTYHPDGPARWKADALALIDKALEGQRLALTGPIDLHVLAVLKRPGKLRRKKDPPGRIWAATLDTGSKPDEDNVLKLVQDTLVQAGVLKDDTFVVAGSCVKVYQGIGEREEQPHVTVWIEQLGEDASVGRIARPWMGDLP